MSIDTDFHSHVSRSSAERMVKSAKEKGLKVLGLSEHVFQMDEGREPLNHMGLEGPMLTLAEYFECVRKAADRFTFDARVGLEVDFIPDKNESIQASIQGNEWDYLIGSIHEIDGVQFEATHSLERSEGSEMWMRYFELLQAAVRSGYFDVVSHPVRMGRRNPFIPDTLDEELEALAAVAAEKNVALEINGFDVLGYPELVKRLARACAAQKTPISVGSDAHRPGGVAQAHRQTEEILREAGLQRVRVWKRREASEYIV